MIIQNNIDPHKIDQVGRLGLNWYSRANADLFELGTPRYKPMGYNSIPKFIKSHKKFNNDLINKLAYHDSSIEIENSNLTDDVSEDEYSKDKSSIKSVNFSKDWYITVINWDI